MSELRQKDAGADAGDENPRTDLAVDPAPAHAQPGGWFACLTRDKCLLILLGLHALLWLPLVARSTDNPQHLAAFVNDEPVITQQLVGMSVRPYGNPANFLRHPW